MSSPDPTTAITSREPLVDIMVCGWPISFLLDTGATYSVLTEFWGPTSRFSVVRVGGQSYFPHQTPPLSCIFRGVPLTHSFLVVPTCPVPLLGRDLLARLGASISFAPCPPICLNPSSPAVLLFLLQASQPINTTMLFPLPASGTRSIPKSGTSRTPLLLNTILLLSSNYLTLPGT